MSLLKTSRPLFLSKQSVFHRLSYEKKNLYSTSTDTEKLHFNELASSWWDVEGPQRILHKMNMLRMDFVNDTIRSQLKLNKPDTSPEDEVYVPPCNVELFPRPIKNTIIADQEKRRQQLLKEKRLSVLDIGCGGGIFCESIARMDFVGSVKGIDVSNKVIEAAKLHQMKDPELRENGKLNYELRELEELQSEEKFDIVTLFELLEHVEFPSKMLEQALLKVNNGGWVFLSTINRDFVSWFTTIFLAEYILKVVPVGTHTLNKYINLEEIERWVAQKENIKDNFRVVDVRGCVYLPACGWIFTRTPDIGNYFMAIQKSEPSES